MPNSSDFNRFAVNPVNIDIQRSVFNMDHSVKTSFNVGDVVPIECKEVLPGDTFEFQTTKVIRTQPLVTPVMDELILDTYYFFVPNRLVWNHWKEFMGENNDSAWAPKTEFQIPQISAPENGWSVGTLADYFGLPVEIPDISVSALPFRAYALIMSEWFRSEALQDPVHVFKDDTSRVGSNGFNQVTDIELGGKPFIASKFFDYFTSALPAPQRGEPVSFDLSGGYFGTGQFPVYSGNLSSISSVGENHGDFKVSPLYVGLPNVSNGFSVPSANEGLFTGAISTAPGLTGREIKLKSGITGTDAESGKPIYPMNLWADGSSIGSFNINDLRTAFAVQRYLERMARSGGRYIEMIKAFFNVDSPDSRLQRSEYLGGSRMPLSVSAVEQTSSTDSVSPQGNVAGMSVTGEVHGDFIHSFTEHGYIIGVVVARYHHSYSQGIDRFWSRKTPYDFYNPVFANLGEMPIKNKEILAVGDVEYDDAAFGYQEAWADYRYSPNKITGLLRPVGTNGTFHSLDIWHFGDEYNGSVYLSDSWIREDKNNVQRTLAVDFDVANQLIGDFLISIKAARPMPLYSIPGLIDHH